MSAPTHTCPTCGGQSAVCDLALTAITRRAALTEIETRCQDILDSGSSLTYVLRCLRELRDLAREAAEEPPP